MTVPRNTVLLGASGLVGGFCLQAVLADASVARVTLLNRRELAIAVDPRLTQKIVNFEELSAADFTGADSVFCALGTTMQKAGSKEAFRRVDLEYPLAAAKAARLARVREFILVSSVGADPRSGNFYLRTKGELEQQLGALGFTTLHIFRPSLLLGRRQEFRLGERVMIVLAPLLNLPLIGGLRRYRAISAENVGKAMTVAARNQGPGVFVYHYKEIVDLASQTVPA
ncbi:MAG TPA: NAD(P)H-binding protein [Candidatus Angelobacter sp.]|nr:NAD(P)H-binding protein [Candidatus Angelobacter sp.]